MITNRSQVVLAKGKMRDLRAHRDAVAGQHWVASSELVLAGIDDTIDVLQREIDEFERLETERPDHLVLQDLLELPVAAIQARIAAGLTQAELADRLDLAESAVQRDEQSNYRGVGFDRLAAVFEVTGVRVLIVADPDRAGLA